jgi:predicted dehydrogenase
MSGPTNLFVDRRWDGDFQTLQRLIQNDALGELTEAEIHYDFENPSWLQTLSE